MSGTDLLITLTGITLVMVALFVELEHQPIWKNYRRNYHPHKNKLVDTMLKPQRWVYIANVYILWPLVLVLGIFILFRDSV